MDIFSSITLNYLPKARVLARTLKYFHPDWKFHLLISDREVSAEILNKTYESGSSIFDRIFYTNDLDIPNLKPWIFKHHVVELCTAVKGPFLNQLISEGCEKIVYIDPDIAVLNSLSPIENLLDQHSILLIPHLVDFVDEPQAILDNEIAGTLRHGTFNLGFLAVNATKSDGMQFADWWGKRLLNFCYADYEMGLFTDQKWCDLVPSFFDDYYVIRDPGYDVASWNINTRKLSFSPSGQLLVNDGYPLRFFHFTGYDSGAGHIMTQRYKESNSIVDEIWAWYHRQLLLMGQKEWEQQQCIYNYFTSGKEIRVNDRITYRNRPDLQATYKNPYEQFPDL